jgi:uncharacterized membrane protein (UPF0127 family)
MSGKHSIIAQNCTSIWESFRGLMFTNRAIPSYFETRFGLHTFFLKYPIDIIVIDGRNIVQIVKQGFKPYRLFFWNPFYQKILELPNGDITRMNIKKGDSITVTLQD